MNRRYVNNSGIPLSVAVFLAHDDYDYDSTTLSATSLLKPIRQLILGKRVPQEDAVEDLEGLVASRMGQAIHSGIENAWHGGREKALQALGYPQRVIDRIRVNPEPHEVTDDIIPVYMEIRAAKEIMGVTITGKFDFLAEGQLEDFKSTSVFTYMNSRKDEDYSLQGSIYRWLNSDKVTSDHLRINYIFTDWKPGMVKTQANYPPNRVVPVMIPLKSLEETEQFVRNKLTQLDKYMDAPEAELPRCTDKELWRTDPKFKYYKNPAKMTKSTKNFDSLAEANARWAADGQVGVVREIPGEVKACRYCPGFSICTQKDELLADGSLKLN